MISQPRPRRLPSLPVSMRPLIAAAACLSLALTGCTFGPYPWHEGKTVQKQEFGSVPNAAAFGEEIYFGAQPAAPDFELMGERGIETVVNLRSDEEMKQLPFDERQAVANAGMNYFHVPIGREEPDAETVEVLNNLIDNPDLHPMFIHCASGNRVGYVWSMTRAARHGLEENAAIDEGKAAGMSSPILEQRARGYIQRTAPAPAGD